MFSVKGQTVNVSGFEGDSFSFADSQLCSCSMKAAGRVSVKPLWTRVGHTKQAPVRFDPRAVDE